jgi:hypothetical protein
MSGMYYTKTSTLIRSDKIWGRSFERAGQFAASATFAEALVSFRKKWWMYYDCADSSVGVATTPEK